VIQLRPRDVLAQYLDLVEMLGDGTSTPVARYLDAVAQMDGLVVGKSAVAPILARNLGNARPYWVTGNMTPVIESRAATMPGITQVEDDCAPPRPCGFVVFENPLRYSELRGRQQIVHVIAWGPGLDQDQRPGWLVQTFNDLFREPDQIAEMIDKRLMSTRALGRWHGISTYWLPRGMRIGPVTLEPTEEDLRRVAEDGDSAFMTHNVRRDVLALWEMLNETLSTHTVEHADRAMGRRMARRKLSTEVTVITLRRQSQPVRFPGSGTSPSYRQWIPGVRRRYWIGSGADRHQEWRTTRGYWWPGDERLPIKDGPKVNRLAR
jgi:hypothetical protein